MKQNPPLVLLTDFGLTDAYAGLLRAVILSIHPQASILDLTHGIRPQDVLQGALILESSYRFFPSGSIFVCVVDPGVGTGRKILCARTGNYYFIGPDNGILALALEHEPKEEIRSVENKRFFLRAVPSSTFHGRDIMSPAAAHLALARSCGRDIFHQLGPSLQKFHPALFSKPRKIRDGLEGRILYFDHFGNAVTSLHRRDEKAAFWEKAQVRVGEMDLGPLRKTYGAGPETLAALFNSFDRLEIAMPGGSAKECGPLEAGETVRVSPIKAR